MFILNHIAKSVTVGGNIGGEFLGAIVWLPGRILDWILCAISYDNYRKADCEKEIVANTIVADNLWSIGYFFGNIIGQLIGLSIGLLVFAIDTLPFYFAKSYQFLSKGIYNVVNILLHKAWQGVLPWIETDPAKLSNSFKEEDISFRQRFHAVGSYILGFPLAVCFAMIALPIDGVRYIHAWRKNRLTNTDVIKSGPKLKLDYIPLKVSKKALVLGFSIGGSVSGLVAQIVSLFVKPVDSLLMHITGAYLGFRDTLRDSVAYIYVYFNEEPGNLFGYDVLHSQAFRDSCEAEVKELEDLEKARNPALKRLSSGHIRPRPRTHSHEELTSSSSGSDVQLLPRRESTQPVSAHQNKDSALPKQSRMPSGDTRSAPPSVEKKKLSQSDRQELRAVRNTGI